MCSWGHPGFTVLAVLGASAVAISLGVILLGPSAAHAAPEVNMELQGSAGSAAAGTQAGASLERVSLVDALGRAMARNPDAAVARLEIDKAEGLLKQARAAELPSLLGIGTYTRLDHDRVTATGIQTGAANQWTGDLSLTVPLLVPTTWAGVHRAISARNLSRTRSEDVRRELGAAVARAYLTVLLQRQQIEVAERSRDTARQHFEFARTRLQGGVGNKLDDVRAEQLLRTEESNVATAHVALTRAQAALGTVVGGERALDAAEAVDLVPPPTSNLAALTDAARHDRSDLKVLESQLSGAKRAHRDVWSLYSPYLTANGLAFVQDLGSVLQPTRGWQVQLVLTLPIYDGGVRSGVERERSATEAEAQVQLDSALRVAALEIRAAFDVMLRADEALAAAQRAVGLAQAAARLASLAYHAGATTNLELIDAERRAHDAESQAAIAEEAAREARLEMLLAAGQFP